MRPGDVNELEVEEMSDRLIIDGSRQAFMNDLEYVRIYSVSFSSRLKLLVSMFERDHTCIFPDCGGSH